MSIKDMKKTFINQSISTAAPQSGQTILIVFIMQYSVYKVCGSVHVYYTLHAYILTLEQILLCVFVDELQLIYI